MDIGICITGLLCCTAEMNTSFPDGSAVTNPSAMQESWVPSLDREAPLEEGIAPHSRILAWRTPWTMEMETGRLQSMGSQRVGLDRANNTYRSKSPYFSVNIPNKYLY